MEQPRLDHNRFTMDPAAASRSNNLTAGDAKQLDQLEMQLTELRKSILNLLWRIETQPETLNWPSTISRFNHITAQLSSLRKIMTSNEMPNLHNITILPLHVQQEVDENLQQLTEGRVSVCNHEVVPNYLRTKLDPDVESHLRQLYQRAQSVQPEQAQKQITAYNKVMKSLCDHFERAVEAHGKTSQRDQTASLSLQKYNESDTQLIAACKHGGKNLFQLSGLNAYQLPRNMPPCP